MSDDQIRHYDVIVFGAGIAGLWLANRLLRAGYNTLVIEKDKIGGVQTMASQGMIHGGQKYTIEGKVTGHAASLSEMPQRWQDCFDGCGEIDLSEAHFLSDNQIMWPAGSILSDVAVFGAAKLVNADTRKMAKDEIPDALLRKGKFKGSVYALPEKVLDIKSLAKALAKLLKGRIVQGNMTKVLPDGQVLVSERIFHGQLLIFTAGTGNEQVFDLLKISKQYTQRRPLRQVMVRTMDHPLYGHGIVGKPKPRLTVTSHPDVSGGYVWYIGGNVAELGADMDEDQLIAFARKELEDVFPAIDWSNRQWATWQGDRAEPYDDSGQLPPGPHVHQRGNILIAWPTKLTFAPALADRIINWMKDKDIEPARAKDVPPEDMPVPEVASYPWETAVWKTLP